jgi:hypothetical protein
MINSNIHCKLTKSDENEFSPIYTTADLFPPRMDLTVAEIMELNDDILKEYSEELRQHFLKIWSELRHPLFSGNKTNDEIINDLRSFQDPKITGELIEDGNNCLIKYNSKRSNPVNCFFPEIWDVKVNGKSVLDQIKRPDIFYKNMTKVVRKQFPESTTINFNHKISKYLLQALRILNRYQPVYNFPPPIARFIYQTAARDCGFKDSDTFKIIDLCAGWSGRFVGALSFYAQPEIHGKKVIYHCTDVNSKVHDRFQRVYKFWEHNINPDLENFEFYKSLVPAENILDDPFFADRVGQYDVSFSSPPYYAKEEYSYDLDQSFIKYNSYVEWSYGFLQGYIKNCSILLKDGGEMWINLADTKNCERPAKGLYHPIERDCLYFAEKHGFKLIREYKIISPIMPGMSRTVGDTKNPEPYHSLVYDGKKKKYEPLFRFKKLNNISNT